MTEQSILDLINETRKAAGFLTLDLLMELGDSGNTILDPFSTLVSTKATVGEANIFYPNVIVECQADGTISIGNRNTFFPNTLIVAADGGTVEIGDLNQFGDGGTSLKANAPGARIVFGDKGRYLNGVQVIGTCTLGSGSQLLGGPLTVQDCHVSAGETFKASDPDMRAGVIKGFGLARGLHIATGKVINGKGSFSQEHLEDQSVYHRKT